MPIGLISLVDADRQWFKARIGLDLGETPRDDAFCAHAILAPDGVLVVEDTTNDPRFADNPLVLGEPGIRFYAGAPILAENGQPLGTLCVCDRTPRSLDAAGRRALAQLAASAGSVLELHRRNRQLADAAQRDALTGLPNRRAFDVALTAACEGLDQGVPFGLLCLDLDGFKQVNDKFGQAAGDALLQDVARRLTTTTRRGDICARLGGDEFAVLLPGPVDMAGAFGAARRIMAALERSGEIGDDSLPIKASIGVALAPEHGRTGAGLMRAADQGLYRAKAGGLSAIMLASSGAADPERPTATLLEEALHQAIAEDGIDLHWQPYFDMHTGQGTGCEALARWHRPGHGLVSPGTFVPLAEKVGLARALDATILRRACREAASFPGTLRISVNISPEWFNGEELPGMVADALARSGFPGERLMLELTERTLVERPDHARAQVAALQRLGVRVALDDFGTGYSSLGYLSDFTFDEVKLDRSFVAGLGQNPRAEPVARAVVELCHALGMGICAEGVETLDQLRLLQAIGCDRVQGFLLARPTPGAGLFPAADPLFTAQLPIAA
jgi:diguanylate cyclase (GGDEF)-like protein